MLYILNFYLPRFMDLSLTEKVTTIFHELWHISPDFDGDVAASRALLRTHALGKEYDAAMRAMADQWLALQPPPEKSTRSCDTRSTNSTVNTVRCLVFGWRIPS